MGASRSATLTAFTLTDDSDPSRAGSFTGGKSPLGLVGCTTSPDGGGTVLPGETPPATVDAVPVPGAEGPAASELGWSDPHATTTRPRVAATARVRRRRFVRLTSGLGSGPLARPSRPARRPR